MSPHPKAIFGIIFINKYAILVIIIIIIIIIEQQPN